MPIDINRNLKKIIIITQYMYLIIYSCTSEQLLNLLIAVVGLLVSRLWGVGCNNYHGNILFVYLGRFDNVSRSFRW